MPRKISIALLILLFIFSSNTSLVYAADFTSSESETISQLRTEYADLDKTPFNNTNIYLVKPKLKYKFKEGLLLPSYRSNQLAYINFYRSLFNLNPVTEDKRDSTNAQKTAAVLAALNANPLINQHNMPYEKRPRTIRKATWKIARNTSNSSNLNFNTANQSAGDVITDWLTDRYNLTGPDTGHRAWLLSTRMTTTGIGAAYGKNGYRYSVQKVLNTKDIFRPASQRMVTYPNSIVFPIELLEGKNIAWSLYFSDQNIDGTPQITITDKNTQKKYKAEKVKNYRNSGYGNFKTIITYSPGSVQLITGHEYQVDVVGICSYSFKLFKLNE